MSAANFVNGEQEAETTDKAKCYSVCQGECSSKGGEWKYCQYYWEYAKLYFVNFFVFVFKFILYI